MRFPVVYKLTVHFVCNQKQVVSQNQLLKLKQLLPGIYITGRIIGIANKDPLRFGTNHLPKFRDGWQLKSVLNGGSDGLNDDIICDGKRLIIGVKRLRNDHLITRIETNHEGKGDRLRSSRRDQYLGGIHLQVPVAVILSKLFAVSIISEGVSVRDQIEIKIPDPFDGVLWSFDVRLTNVQVVNLAAKRFGFFGIGNQFSNGRFR